MHAVADSGLTRKRAVSAMRHDFCECEVFHFKNLSHYGCKCYLLTFAVVLSSIFFWISVFYWNINEILGFKEACFVL